MKQPQFASVWIQVISHGKHSLKLLRLIWWKNADVMYRSWVTWSWFGFTSEYSRTACAFILEASAGRLAAVTVRRVGVDGSPGGPEEVLSRSRRSVRLDDHWAEPFLHGLSAGEAEVVSAAPQTKLSVQEAAQTNIRSVLTTRCFCCWAGCKERSCRLPVWSGSQVRVPCV